MRLLIFIFAFVSSFAPFAHAAPKQEDWDITELSEQTFLFDKKNVSVLVDVDFAPDADEAVAKFIKSSDFVKAMKRLRNSGDLGLEGEALTVSASRKQYGPTYVGITESLFKLGDRSAVLTEHWWVKNHLTFHVSILSRGTYARSDDEQEKIFEPFAKDLGLIPGATARFDFLIPEAHADELRRNGGRTGGARRSTTPAEPSIDCKRDAAKYGIDPAVARTGPPSLAPSFSGATCKAGVARLWTETKKSVIDLGRDYANRAARLRRQLQCTGQPPPPKYESARRGETYYGMFARWGRNIGTAVTYSGASQVASNCEEAAGNGAMAQMAGNAIVGTVRGLVTLGQLTQQLQYELTVGQVRRASQLIRYGKIADSDPMLGLASMIGDQWAGFKCYTDREQATKLCKIGAEVGITVASMAVGGGVTAAARLARIASVVGRAVEAEQALMKTAAAAKEAQAIARAARVAREAQGGVTTAREVEATAKAARAVQATRAANADRQVAASAVRNLNMTAAERARATQRVLGRELSQAERAAVEKAHAFGRPGANGQYSVGDLREKLRIMTAEGGLSKDEALKLLRTGVTGEAPAVSATALAAAATEQTPVKLQPGASVADTTIVTSANAGKPASFFREQAEVYQKTWRQDLDLINDADLSPAELAIRDVPQKASDVSRMLMRSISPEDIASTEFITDAAGERYMRMMRLASFGGNSTSSDAATMMARVVREMPEAKRGDFLGSLNNQFTLQIQAMRGDRTLEATRRMGRAFPTVIQRTYREIVDNAMGFTSSESAAAKDFYRRLDSSTTRKQALDELMERPQMRGIDRQEIDDLRMSADSAMMRAREMAEAEERAARGATREKPINNGFGQTVVPLGRLNNGR